MKTIKSLIKEFLMANGSENTDKTVGAENSDKQTPPESVGHTEETGNHGFTDDTTRKETLTVTNNLKNNEDETENHEMAGVSDVADTAAAELPGDPEKSEETDREALKRAYEEGYIAGRNSSIEEKYFPKEDGIPHFHGSPSQNVTGNDIFSIAREA